jgi:membrane protein implicated in regulation of membrane protease activity
LAIYIKKEKKESKDMWVVFLLAAMGFAIATLLVVYIGNKVVNAMKRDDEKLNKDISKEKTNEKEKEKHE